MPSHDKEFTLAPRMDISDFVEGAKKLESLCSSMSSDFLKFDEKSVAAINSFEKALKQLSEAISEFSRTMTTDFSSAFKDFKFTELTQSISSIKNEIVSLKDELKKADLGTNLSSQLQNQFAGIQQQITETTKQVSEQMVQLAEAMSKVDRSSIRVNLSNVAKDTDMKAVREMIKELNTQVKTNWDVSSLVSGVTAIKSAIKDVDEKKLSEIVKAGNTAGKINRATKPEPHEIDSQLAVSKQTIDNLANGQRIIQGWSVEGAKVRETMDESGKIIGATVTHLNRSEIVTRQAVANLKSQQKVLKDIGTLQVKETQASGEMRDLYRELRESKEAELTQLQQEQFAIEQTTLSMEQRNRIAAELNTREEISRQNMVKVREAEEAVVEETTTWEKVTEQIAITLERMVTFYVFSAIKQGLQEAIQYSTEFYDQLNEIRVVTGKTEEEARALGDSFRNLGREMGVSSQDIASGAITYFRQGLDDSEVEERLRATTAYAKAAALSFDEAAQLITASTNAMGQEAEHVADIFLYLGDNSASSGEEIGRAMSKAAATANAAGVSFEMLGAYIATVSEKTRQDAGTIGTALNAMMSRLMSVKQKGFNDEDETKVNDIAKALRSVNIELTDGQGEWRAMSDIYTEIGSIWDELDDKTKNYLGTTMAGVRQQNVFRTLMEDIAKMNDLTGDGSRVMELYQGTLDAAGTSAEKLATWQESIGAAQERLSVEWQTMVSNLNLGDTIKDLTNVLAEFLSVMNEVMHPSEPNVEPYVKTREEVERLLEINGYRGHGGTILMRQVATALGYDAGAITKEQAQDVFKEIQRLSSDISPYMLAKSEQPIQKMIQEYFSPNGVLDLELYDQWEKGIIELGDHIVDAFKTETFGISKNDAVEVLFDNLVAEMEEFVNTDPDLPQIGKLTVEKMLSGMYGENWSLDDLNQDTTSGLLNMGKKYAQDYNNLQSVVALTHANSGVFGDQQRYDNMRLAVQLIKEFNETYGTTLTFDSIDSIVFPKDQDEVDRFNKMLEGGRKLKAMREEQQQAVEAYYQTIQEGASKAELARKKAGGFQEEVADLQSQMWAAMTSDDKTFTDVYNYYMKMATDETTKALYDAFSSEYADTFFDMMEALHVGDTDTAFAKMNELVASSAKEAKEELSDEEKQLKATKEALNTMFDKYSTEEKKQHLEDTNWAEWIEQIQALAAAENGGGLYEWMLGQDQDLLTDFLDAYPTLKEFFALINANQGNIGWIDGAAESFKKLLGTLPTKKEADAVKKLREELTKSSASDALKASKANGFAVERGQLMSFFAENRNDVIKQLQGYQNGNVDLVLRPVIDSSKLAKAGWTDEDGRPISGGDIATLFSETFGNADMKFAFTATPILPNGDVLSPDTFYEYIDKLCGFETIEEALAYDKDNNNLLINWLGVPEGTKDIDAFLDEYGKLGETLHNLHEQLYGGQGTNVDSQNLINTLISWQESGTLSAMNSDIEGLEALVGQILEDADDGVINNTKNIEKLREMLFDTTSAWKTYGDASSKALKESVPDNQTGIELLGRVAEAVRSNTVDALWGSISEDEQKYIEKSVEGWDKYAAGVQSAQETLVNLDKTINNMTITDLVKNGGALANSDKWFKSAIEGTADFYDSLNSANKSSEKLYNAWESLIAIQSGVTMSDKVLAAAYDLISDATGLSTSMLQGDGGLIAAEQALMMQTDQTTGTLNFLMTQLQQTGAVDFRNANWKSQLQALANDSNNAMQMVAQLTQALLNIPKNIDVSINVSQNGTVAIQSGGGFFSSLKNGLSQGGNALKTFGQNVVNIFKNAASAAQTKVASSGGGGGGSRNDDTADNLKSEIEKMIDLMDQIQDLYEYEQSLFEAMRDAYEQDKLLQGVIMYYQKEADAIAANNLVLEDNIAKIEALLPQQQALVAAMSTTDENYKQASSDLEKLQSAHQEYTKALIENQTKIKEYNQKIKDTYDKIRDMEIDLRNTILKAIEDREQREESMLSARISLENEVFDIIKKRYEDERDQILETANIRKSALKEESSLLDENLAKRKAAAEQEDKQAELLKLQQQLIRISADPTRRAEQDSLRKQIKELQDELAWDEAEKEVDAQKESIEKQINNLEDYMEYVEDYYEDMFEHPQKLLAETQEIMNKTHGEILAWLQANNEEFVNSSVASQQRMTASWEETLMQMRGDIKTYWDEVEYIISQGEDYIINFLMENSADYRAAGKLQAEAYVDEWKQQLNDLKLAYQSVYDDIQMYNYDTIRLDESSSSSGGSSGGRGGGKTKTTTTPGKNNTSTTSTTNLLNKIVDGAAGILEKVTNGAKSLAEVKDNINKKISSVTPVATATTVRNNDIEASSGLAQTSSISSPTYQQTKNATTAANNQKQKVNDAINNVLSKLGLKNAAGGEHDQTGWTWIDGTVSRPERILSAEQTELFDMLVSDLHQAVRTPVSMGAFGGWSPDGSMSGNTFGDINIVVESLDSDADYEELAERVMEEISERMNRGHAVGGIRRTR